MIIRLALLLLWIWSVEFAYGNMHHVKSDSLPRISIQGSLGASFMLSLPAERYESAVSEVRNEYLLPSGFGANLLIKYPLNSQLNLFCQFDYSRLSDGFFSQDGAGFDININTQSIIAGIDLNNNFNDVYSVSVNLGMGLMLPFSYSESIQAIDRSIIRQKEYLPALRFGSSITLSRAFSEKLRIGFLLGFLSSTSKSKRIRYDSFAVEGEGLLLINPSLGSWRSLGPIISNTSATLLDDKLPVQILNTTVSISYTL